MIHIDLMYISMISILAPTFLGVALFKQLPMELKLLALFIFITCIMDGVVYVAWQFNVNNIAVFHLFTYIEFGIISLIYSKLFKAIRVVRYSIMTLSAMFLILSIYLLYKHEHLDTYNSLQRALEHIIVLIYVVLFLFLYSRRHIEERLLLKPYFILSIGFLTYFSLMFLVFLDANNYLGFDNFFNWSIHSVLNIFLNIIYFAVLWIGGKQRIKRSEKHSIDK